MELDVYGIVYMELYVINLNSILLMYGNIVTHIVHGSVVRVKPSTFFQDI